MHPVRPVRDECHDERHDAGAIHIIAQRPAWNPLGKNSLLVIIHL